MGRSNHPTKQGRLFTTFTPVRKQGHGKPHVGHIGMQQLLRNAMGQSQPSRRSVYHPPHCIVMHFAHILMCILLLSKHPYTMISPPGGQGEALLPEVPPAETASGQPKAAAHAMPSGSRLR